MKKNKKALLVNPYIHDFKAYDFWLKPIGLLKIASILKENGWNVTFIDLLDRKHPALREYGIKTKNGSYGRGKFPAEEIEKPKVYKDVPRRYKRYGIPVFIFKKLLEKIDYPFDMVLVTTGMTYWYLGVEETVKIIKEFFPKAPVLIGGIYATLLPQHAEKYGKVLKGEFEENITKFEEITNTKIKEIQASRLAYELYSSLDYVVIYTTKGCPYNCSYCAIKILQKEFKIRPPNEVIDEIMYYAEKFKVKDFVFYDDALLSNPYFKNILIAIIKSNKKLRFHTPNGINPALITEETAELMYEAGFTSLYLSLETVDEELQKRTGGKLTKKQFERGVKILKRKGFKTENLHSYVIAGLPEQSEESIMETIKFSIELGVIPHIAEYSPIPKTKEYPKTGLKETDDPLLHNNTAYPYIFKTYNPERIKSYLEEQKKSLITQ